MTSPFAEEEGGPGPAAVALSHFSVELGHLYFEDFAQGPEHLVAYFREVLGWYTAARRVIEAQAGRRPRISTCFLLDDYFGPTQSPRDVVPLVLAAAAEAGLTIDYLARESACAEADGVALAQLVQHRIVADPAPGTNGSRPPAQETGWLSNGQRSPEPGQAMGSLRGWAPPAEHGTARHSIFVDVELRGGGKWSCAYLASIWQLLRLGLVRAEGAAVAVPAALPDPLPGAWSRLPAVAQVNPAGAPFSAYRTFSILGTRFMPTEHAVRTILSQVAIDPAVDRNAVERAAHENVTLPPEVVGRLQYLFF